MLRQLFISGAVAACNMEVLIAMPYVRSLCRFVLLASVIHTFEAARFTRIYPNSIR